jgi:hypothetical protein
VPLPDPMALYRRAGLLFHTVENTMNDTQMGATAAALPKPRLTVRSRYRTIDVLGRSELRPGARAEAWPDAMPGLSEAEATKAARKLVDKFYFDRWYEAHKRKRVGPKPVIPVRITSGNRYNWFRSGKLVINPGAGWKRLVHELSHDFFRRLFPGKPPHHFEHTHLEKAMVAYVIERGWLDGKLAPKPRAKKPTPDPVKVAHERLLARIKGWETRAKRAETALKKLRAQEKKLAKKVAALAA